jgi:hypothetical protein
MTLCVFCPESTVDLTDRGTQIVCQHGRRRERPPQRRRATPGSFTHRDFGRVPAGLEDEVAIERDVANGNEFSRRWAISRHRRRIQTKTPHADARSVTLWCCRISATPTRWRAGSPAVAPTRRMWCRMPACARSAPSVDLPAAMRFRGCSRSCATPPIRGCARTGRRPSLVEDLEGVEAAQANPGDLERTTPESELIAKADAASLETAIAALPAAERR